MVPKKYALLSGIGEANTSLAAYDAALIDAGIGNCNLVELSSIIPPNAEEDNPPEFPPGSIIPAVVAKAVGRDLVSSCVCVGRLESGLGIVSERAATDSIETVRRLAERDVEEMARLRGERLVEVRTVTASTEPENAEWAAAVAMVVFWGGPE
ncbi:pyruvoyl-dependent arginine decarboxylase [Methanopyrus sp.]